MARGSAFRSDVCCSRMVLSAAKAMMPRFARDTRNEAVAMATSEWAGQVGSKAALVVGKAVARSACAICIRVAPEFAYE
jgi:hypothetical protein